VLRSQSRKEPELLAGAGAETSKVSAPAPGSGSAKVVNKNKNSHWIGSSMWMRSVPIILKKHEKFTFEYEICDNR
jgi:DNA modification methylase